MKGFTHDDLAQKRQTEINLKFIYTKKQETITTGGHTANILLRPKKQSPQGWSHLVPNNNKNKLLDSRVSPLLLLHVDIPKCLQQTDTK